MRSPRGIRVLEESVADLQVALETSRACTCTVRSVSLNKIIAVLSSRPYFNIFVPYVEFYFPSTTSFISRSQTCQFIRIRSFYPGNNNNNILSLLLLSAKFSRPAVSVQLVHVSAQPRTRAVKIEPVHSVELLFISLLQ